MSATHETCGQHVASQPLNWTLGESTESSGQDLNQGPPYSTVRLLIAFSNKYALSNSRESELRNLKERAQLEKPDIDVIIILKMEHKNTLHLAVECIILAKDRDR
jgi:hypothetical protein